MSLNQLDSKKQFAVLVLAAVLLMGLYLQFRFMPAVAEVGQLNKQLKADKSLLKAPNIPEEPFENVEELKDEIVDLEVELEQLTQQSSSLAKKLPEADSQDLMLKISELARSSRVRIVNNVPFLTKKRVELKLSATGNKKKLTAKEKRKQERRVRKAMKKARKNAGKSTGIGVYTREGELMDKLVNGFAVSRPLHKLKVEGTYSSMKAFVEGLQGLPWQVTIVKIDYNLLGSNAAQGYAQPLMVDMIIGA